MAQGVKALAADTEPDDLNSITETHMVDEENQSLKVDIYPQTHEEAHIHAKKNK